MTRALLLALMVTASVTLALADEGLPPPRYDVGGSTIQEVLDNYTALFGQAPPPVHQVAWGEAGALCNDINLELTGWPMPVPDYTIRLGCVAGRDSGAPEIVISIDPFVPDDVVIGLRHEIGHLLGWPANHDRGMPTP